MTRIYLDNAASTPLAPEVFDAMVPYLRDHFGNPSAVHANGRAARAAVEQARRSVARLINCAPGEVVFTSGGTEADNMVLRCAVRDLGVKHIVTSPIEHHAVERPARSIGEAEGAQVHWLRLQPDGAPDLRHLEEVLQGLGGQPALVSLMHANNEIGTRIDLDAVGAICRRHGALFHSDTIQTMGHYPFDMARTPVDFITCSAHKFHGPKGTGFLYMRSGAVLKPMILGGSQERNMRAGTENVAGIVGMAKALELAFDGLEEHQRHVQGLKERMKRRVLEAVPGASVNGDAGPGALYTVLNIHFPDNGRSEMLLYSLDIEGVACSGGSACSSGGSKGSHVLSALFPERKGANIRFSFSRYTTEAEVDRAVEVLKRLFEPEPAKA